MSPPDNTTCTNPGPVWEGEPDWLSVTLGCVSRVGERVFEGTDSEKVREGLELMVLVGDSLSVSDGICMDEVTGMLEIANETEAVGEIS